MEDGLDRDIPENIREPFEQPPAGTLIFKVTEAKMDEIGANKTFAIQADLEVVEPAEAQGIQWTNTFFIGTPEDPSAKDPSTLERRLGRFEKFCNKAGIVNIRKGKLSVVCSDLKQRKVKGFVSHVAEPEWKKNPQTGQMEKNQYFGRTRAQVNTWFSTDEGGTPLVLPSAPIAAPSFSGGGQTAAPPPGGDAGTGPGRIGR